MLGYYVVSRFVTERFVTVPPLVGLSVHEALRTMAQQQLYGQIIAEHSSSELAPGVVFDQAPAAGGTIKTSQPVYLTVTARPPDPVVPLWYHLTEPEIRAAAAAEELQVHFHEVESHYPRGKCFAQDPAPGIVVPDRTVHCYLSKGITPLRLMPSFAGQTVPAVAAFCQQQGIQLQLFHATLQPDGHHCGNCVVREQKPLSGTIIDMDKPLVAQVLIVSE